MKGIATFLLPLAAILMVACGSSAPAVPADTSNSVAPVTAAGRSLKALAGKILETTVDSCTWESSEAGGQVELNVSFSVVNKSEEPIMTTFRVQNSSGTIYRRGGTASDIFVNPGETGNGTIQTGKFPVDAKDLSLIISKRGRPAAKGIPDRIFNEVVPLDQCTQP